MLDLRHAFHHPSPAAVELRAFTHGLMPKTVPAMMERFVEDWRVRGVDAWNEVPNHWRPGSGEAVGWWTLPAYLGDHFIAPLLGAPSGTCIMQPNVHWTMNALLSADEVFAGGRNEVVTTGGAFPSVLHTLQRWQGVREIHPVAIPLQDDGMVNQQSILQGIGPKTALVVLSHVGFTTSEKLPDAFLAEVATKVHGYGGLFAIDGYHATASVPVRVEDLGCDLYVGGLLKEACGSSGNAYVYVRPGLNLTPRLTGWLGDAAPFGFEESPSVHPAVRQRFLGGTTSVASFYHAVEGVRVLIEAGLEAVRQDSLEKTAYCIERAEAGGLALRSPREAEERGAMVVVEAEAADRLCAHLKKKDIYTDSRKGRYLRMAPFVWNTMEELERTFDVIEEVVASAAYLDVSVADGVGPVT